MAYFLTGLPRSRTAWFSEFLPDCLHEGMNGCYTKQEYIYKLGVGGDSSSGLMYFPIHEFYPGARVVIVQRDIDEVIESLATTRFFDKDSNYSFLFDMSDRLDKMDGLRVDFHNLDLEEIWDYLIGGDFNKDRADKLNNMNIQKLDGQPNVEAMISFLGGK